MTEDIRSHVLAALAEIAPEADTTTLDPEADLADEYDLDSMDLYNLVVALEARLGVEILERDYPHLRTLAGAVAHLDGLRAGHRT